MKRRSTNAPSRSSTGTQAVDRAVAILKAFAEQDRWGLADLAPTLGLHKTTAFRLLHALERGGLVAREDDGSYRLGPDLLALGTRALRSMNLHGAARGELEALAADTGETTTLEILVGADVLILDEVRGHHIIGSKPEIGTRWPAHATSTGKVLLAAARYEGSGLPRMARLARLTPRTIGTMTRLARELALVRRRGFATARGEVERGFVAIGAAVRDHEGRVIAAISAGGPSTRLTADRIPGVATLVRRSAERISRRLGAPPRPPVTTSAPTRRARRASSLSSTE